MVSHNLQRYLRLRLLVGFLGERSQYGWWPTSFFGTSSGMFLEPVFPKTAKLAQYHGVTEAARRLHDEHIGVGSVFHLFRLPQESEQAIHSVMLDDRGNEELFVGLEDREKAIQALAELADGGATVVSEGPVSVAKVKDVLAAPTVKGVAQSYLAAFEGGIRIYPYFSAS